jgi:transaldolase
MSTGYFHRVAQETPTRFWSNNPSDAEVERALEAGAVGCTTNPAYGAKLLQSDQTAARGLIDRATAESGDDDAAADRVAQEAARRLAVRFLPLFEQTHGADGYVTVQSDPRQDEDARAMADAALRYRAIGPNFMAKIPVTAAGLEAIEILIAEDVPICATEVFSVAQAMTACELYDRVAQRADRYPRFFVTHITGIFDEYLARVVEQEGIAISALALDWAGATVARKEYRLIKDRKFSATLLGGGARSPRHFTDLVGGDARITINWSTAQALIDADPPAVSKIDEETPLPILDELAQMLPDFGHAYDAGGLPIGEFADFGPVQFFRDNFIAGYERLLAEISARRQAQGAAGSISPA